MSDNNLIPFNNSIIESSKSQLPQTIVPVTYRKIDDKYYGFYYNLDDDVKILTYTKDVLINKMHDRHSAEVIRSTFNVLGKKIGSEIAEMKEERNELNKELLSEMEAYYKCVRNTENALTKMLKAVQ